MDQSQWSSSVNWVESPIGLALAAAEQGRAAADRRTDAQDDDADLEPSYCIEIGRSLLRCQLEFSS